MKFNALSWLLLYVKERSSDKYDLKILVVYLCMAISWDAK